MYLVQVTAGTKYSLLLLLYRTQDPAVLGSLPIHRLQQLIKGERLRGFFQQTLIAAEKKKIYCDREGLKGSKLQTRAADACPGRALRAESDASVAFD